MVNTTFCQSPSLSSIVILSGRLCTSHISIMICLSNRIARLNEGPFRPLEDELQAEQAVNVLLLTGLTVPVAASLLQTALAYLYFRFGHAWSRVMFAGHPQEIIQEVITEQGGNSIG